MHDGRPGVVPDPNTRPSPPRPTPSWGPKCLQRPDHSTGQYGEVSGRRRCRKTLVPHLKGLVKPATPCVYTQNAECFFYHFLWAPKGSYVAISDVIPLLRTPKKAGVM